MSKRFKPGDLVQVAYSNTLRTGDVVEDIIIRPARPHYMIVIGYDGESNTNPLVAAHSQRSNCILIKFEKNLELVE